ncbi:hypothetical protein EVAR_101745_1 [Eumeta japonica]|uniref:Peptidase M28 domain-containing protein n=1 Tax=Eumeta variegata TaxID=151549 RepID=A0A4C1SMF9_EUMVA|nr:hypothetical protein EVAR_101745_1 [Eumeta japonica]
MEDFGQVYGVDIAFVKWGNVYHTRYDDPSTCRPARYSTRATCCCRSSAVGNDSEIGVKMVSLSGWLIVELLHSVLGRIYSIVIGSLITMMLMWFMGMTTTDASGLNRIIRVAQAMRDSDIGVAGGFVLICIPNTGSDMC